MSRKRFVMVNTILWASFYEEYRVGRVVLRLEVEEYSGHCRE